MALEKCPQCKKQLYPPLHTTGRQVCASCRWSDRPIVRIDRVSQESSQTAQTAARLGTTNSQLDPIDSFTGHSGWIGGVRTVSFSPSGNIVAAGSDDCTIKLWDLNTGQEKLTLSKHSKAIRTITFSPDGKILASGSDDTSIKLCKPSYKPRSHLGSIMNRQRLSSACTTG